MSKVTLPHTLVDGTIAFGSEVQGNDDALASTVNAIDNDNIVSAANISPTKLDSTAVGRSLLQASSAGSARATIEARTRNELANGDASIWQRGTSFDSTGTPNNDDDTVLADRWILLSDGNDIVDVEQETSTIPASSRAAFRFEIATANAKFGWLQILENENSRPLIGTPLRLSFAARVSGSPITKIKGAVVEWVGTADAPTTDLVAAWNGDEVTPTLVTNWSFSSTPATLADLTSSYQTYQIENITVGSSATNVGVFLWMDSIDGSNPTVGDQLLVSNVQLERGDFATPFASRSIQEELALCERYFTKTFNQGVAPSDSTGDDQGLVSAISVGTGPGDVTEMWEFPVIMRVPPTVTTYNPDVGGTTWRDTGGLNRAATVTNIGTRSCRIANSGTVTASRTHTIHASADAEF